MKYLIRLQEIRQYLNQSLKMIIFVIYNFSKKTSK